MRKGWRLHTELQSYDKCVVTFLELLLDKLQPNFGAIDILFFLKIKTKIQKNPAYLICSALFAHTVFTWTAFYIYMIIK